MIVMGIDYGAARVGVALCDDALPTEVVRPVATVTGKGRREVVEKIAQMARDRAADLLVVGIPLAPDGGVGTRAAQARNFARDLESRTGLATVLQDERDSSREALERLIAAGVPMKKRAERVDEMAAVVILERYMRSRRQ